MNKSKIEWTETTWNPVTGCTKISAGCKFCYAEAMTRRLKGMCLEKYSNGFDLTIHENALEIPYSWKKPKVVFVNSMSDLFHKDVPLTFIRKVFKVMNENPQHTFQVLTKRSERLLELSKKIKWTPNIWQGVTVENASARSRIEDLRLVGAHTKFLSIEPLIGPVTGLNLAGIDWVIVGGESGPGARPMKQEWVTTIRDVCLKTKTPFFFKQWGGVRKKENGRTLENRIWNEMPIIQ